MLWYCQTEWARTVCIKRNRNPQTLKKILDMYWHVLFVLHHSSLSFVSMPNHVWSFGGSFIRLTPSHTLRLVTKNHCGSDQFHWSNCFTAWVLTCVSLQCELILLHLSILVGVSFCCDKYAVHFLPGSQHAWSDRQKKRWSRNRAFFQLQTIAAVKLSTPDNLRGSARKRKMIRAHVRVRIVEPQAIRRILSPYPAAALKQSTQ